LADAFVISLIDPPAVYKTIKVGFKATQDATHLRYADVSRLLDH
jgi:hypothetical protein